MALSSTTRIGAALWTSSGSPASAAASATEGVEPLPAGTAPSAVLAALARGTMNQNVLPRPGVLSTPISPDISSIRRFEMARPRPVPPYLRAVEASACEKGWNRRWRASGAMPIPVS